eukprot:CAMPEP_0117481090 /NCGR_PEP_ID=MMETSP0784-20121206/12724_1 /TAXON_ID=39447 /ORGANISM="" /LENGTH=498 /DNA_ID=CAMNT_0005275543 /DNA_START=40 /DNA_END=1535 /DNA_ORIENTATION=-
MSHIYTQACQKDGAELHRTVPPEKWCVTKSDLRRFLDQVADAVRDGSIRPTMFDPFDPTDHIHGPNIHTVVKQLVRPVTHMAGDMSWALMLHEEGLQCDLFVTHCWKEGIYEFVGKVLGAWPFCARGAYCCMLSNPQNLDISAMVSNPRESPFAYSLAAAKYMLVVSNRRCSIYSRVWCVYEAYLAVQWDKTIYTATPPIRNFWRQLLLIIVSYASGLGACGGMKLPVLVTRGDFALGTIVFPMYALFLVSLSLLVVYGGIGKVMNHSATVVAAFTNGCFAGIFLWSALGGDTKWFELAGLGDRATWQHTGIAVVGLLSMSVALEADRLWMLAAESQAYELRNGFTGKIINASSTHAQDKERILHEVLAEGRCEIVDAAIGVLIRAGMSTPNLRNASTCGSELVNAGGYKLTFIVWGLTVLVSNSVSSLGCGNIGNVWGVVLLAEFVIWCTFWAAGPTGSPGIRGDWTVLARVNAFHDDELRHRSTGVHCRGRKCWDE